jgi:hypothetical protein
MKLKRSKLRDAIVISLAAGAVAFTAAGAASAQESEATEPQQASSLDTITVTGTRGGDGGNGHSGKGNPSGTQTEMISGLVQTAKSQSASRQNPVDRRHSERQHRARAHVSAFETRNAFSKLRNGSRGRRYTHLTLETRKVRDMFYICSRLG